MSHAVDDYLRRLQRELQRRAQPDGRTLEEAREHLLDAVAAARARGLPLEDAEREALERFGPPETIATHAHEQRDDVMRRMVNMFSTAWERKWWILVPTVVTALVASLASYHFLPPRYRAESVVGILPPRVPAPYVRPAVDDAAAERLQLLRQQVLSRTRLEGLIREFHLYDLEQAGTPLAELVRQMRGDVTMEYLASDRGEYEGLRTVRVSYVARDPDAAAKVTQQLASLMVQENVEEQELRAESIQQFLHAEIHGVRQRLLAYEQKLEELRSRNRSRPLSPADLTPYEVLQQRYRELLVKAEEASTAVHLERRQIGEQFRIVGIPRVPDEPIGPRRLSVNLAGTFLGLALGVALVRKRGRASETAAPSA